MANFLKNLQSKSPSTVHSFIMRFSIFIILKIDHVQKPCTLSPMYGVRLYNGSELSKHLSKGLLQMQKIEPDPNFHDGRKFRRQCVNVIDTT